MHAIKLQKESLKINDMGLAQQNMPVKLISVIRCYRESTFKEINRDQISTLTGRSLITKLINTTHVVFHKGTFDDST